ncbi:MAG TPA: TonB-dependent receptor [Alphaproteobacteria bacterium]|nr:TonB-dependent receptor [Alphaproteobacteria bacterium]USO05127.1 MAG: TonB-dependent receptor [Rhodospirillales bacterium]HOO82633.1 TonB-dependent receptor [Alphaproteobacteria bacterium]
MHNIFKYSAFGASLLVSSFLVAPSYAEEIIEVDPIAVEALMMMSYPASASYDSSDAASPLRYSDGADYLGSLPGVTAARFGGHGLEPFIRGQSQGQLNIVNGDSYVFGGCPNRMDPPSAYMNIQLRDTVTVIQGYQSVLNGFGGSGGSVIVEQGRPDFGEALAVTGLVQGGYDGNSEMWNAGANVTAGTLLGYANAYGSYKDAENYEDGDGDEVRAAFIERSGGLKVGYTPEGAHLSLGADYRKINDALFPGAGMDSPLSKGQTFKAALERDLDGKIFQRVKVSTYASLVDHIMDNFSLRPFTAAMPLRVDSQSDTYGAKLEKDFVLFDQPVESVLEWRRNNRNADRIVNTTGALQSLLWPDITINEASLAGESAYDLGDKSRLVVGGRYDYVHVDYGRADTPAPAAGNRTPNDIYSQFYGYGASSKTEHNLGGLLRLEHDYSASTLFYTGLSRSVRTADATERGLANFMGAGGATSWVGNPDIDPEKHHQMDIGFDITEPVWSFGGSAYANYVEDYILRDSARSQPGILVNFPDADIYRNINAFLAGFEVRGFWRFASDWTLEADATCTFGADIDAGRALPQIPPLQGKVGVTWQALDYLEVSGKARWALEQTRVDTNSLSSTGRDVDKTNGYAVFDLEGTITEFDPASLNFGVKNIFDSTYANHLNRSNISDPTEVQVNEPGRSFYVQLRVPF